MYLSKRVDYALRGMYCVAKAKRPVFVKDVAQHEGIPQSSLAKVFQTLAHHGLVSSARGRTGGFVLGRRPEQITLARIIETLDGPILPQGCPFADEACRRKDCCFVYNTWRNAAWQMLCALDRVTLRDLLNSEEARCADERRY